MASRKHFVLRTERSCLDSKDRTERGYVDVISMSTNIFETKWGLIIFEKVIRESLKLNFSELLSFVLYFSQYFSHCIVGARFKRFVYV